MSDRDENGAYKLGRRQLLKGGGAALAVATLGPLGLFSGRTASAAGTAFSSAYFSERMGAFFHVDAGGGWSPLELVDLTPDQSSPMLDQFTVRFRGSANTAFDEGVYVVEAPDGDAFELHIQPRGAGADGAYYDATFSLIKPLSPSCAG